MDPYGLSPLEEQRIQAETLRAQQVLSGAQAKGSRFDNLAAISQLINNKGAAEAAGMARTSAQASAKPTQLGNTGFMVNGEYVTNPGQLEEKMTARAQQRGLAAERLQAQKDMQADRLAQQAQIAAEARALRMTIAGMRGSGGSGGGKAEGEGKTLPYGAIKDITTKEGIRDSYVALTKSFKPEFSGTAGIADMQNLAGRYFPKATGKGDQANWWQNHQEQTNLIRNQLFGSALTAPEKAAFDAQSVTPGMDAKEIERRLGQQAVIADRAYSKIVKGADASGYNTSGFSPDAVAAPAMKPGQPLTAPATKGTGRAAPKGIDPADWAEMTPQEQALWK